MSNNKMHKPNFFIVGAPKSGTTAMRTYLSAHPEVYMPKKAEVHFFGSDLSGSMDIDTYYNYFKNVTSEACIGEKSVFYLLSKTAAEEIKEFSPDAKIIIMLRQPVNMLYSYYWQVKYNGWEDKPTFIQALDAEDKRRKGENIPETCTRPEALLYRDVVTYSRQVQRYLRTFDPDKIHIIIYDDFKQSTETVYADTLDFLGVDSNFLPADFKRVNTNKIVRSKLLRDFMIKNPLKPFMVLGHWLPRDFRQQASRQWFKALRKINTKYTSRPPLNDATAREVNEWFLDDIKILETLIDRDLSQWYEI